MMEFYDYLSPIGKLYIGVEGDSLVSLDVIQPQVQDEQKSAYKPVIGTICKFLDDYFAGEPAKINFKISPKGTAFQLKVYDELLKIPYGEFTTYKEIAKKVFENNPCAQAVGGAVGKNPILIVIPCHRVLGSNRSLTGFSAGLDKKVWLLNHEGIPFKS